MKTSRLFISATAALIALSSTTQAQQPRPPSDRPLPVPRAQDRQPTPPAVQPRVTTQDRTSGVNTDTNRVAQAFRNVFVPLKWEDLPPAVQNTVKQQGGSEKIADIDREDRKGQTVYEIEFEREGKNLEIHVAADGKLLPAEYEAVAPRREGPDATEPQRKSLEGMIYVGPRFEDLPAAVQQTVKQHAKSDQIADIDIERRTGRLVYEIEFETAGRNYEIHVAEDGTFIPEATGLDPAPGAGTKENAPTPDLPLPR